MMRSRDGPEGDSALSETTKETLFWRNWRFNISNEASNPVVKSQWKTWLIIALWLNTDWYQIMFGKGYTLWSHPPLRFPQRSSSGLNLNISGSFPPTTFFVSFFPYLNHPFSPTSRYSVSIWIALTFSWRLSWNIPAAVETPPSPLPSYEITVMANTYDQLLRVGHCSKCCA